MQAVLRPRYLQGVGLTATGTIEPEITSRIADLGATSGAGVLLHGAEHPRDADGTRTELDRAWAAIHAHKPQPGVIILLTPPGADAHAAALRAGLENLARTLSIEWARHAIRTVAVHQAGDPQATAELVAYLAGPAGAYFSGSAITLRPPTGPRPSSPSASPAPPRTPPAPSPSG